jgi:hypothetical protein
LQINIFLIFLFSINHQLFYMRLKHLFFFLYLIANCYTSVAQNVGIGTTTPDISAALEISSTDKGLLIPRLTLAQRPASPANGLMYFQTDNTPGIYIFNGGSWNLLGNGGLSGSGSTGRLALFSGANSLTSNAGLSYNSTIGRLDVNSTNNGTGFTNWIAGNFGGTAGNRVIAGVLNGDATIAAHTNDLSNWAKLVINPVGSTAIGSLAGTGVRMVTTAADGTLGFQEIPAGAGGTVTNVLADAAIGNPITIANGSTTPTINIPVASASANGYLSSSNWTTFNNKQNVLSNASASVSGILTSTDWNTFNNKQNALSNASSSVSGILTSTDWNTFSNKFTLPSLTSGSVLFSNGTTIAQNNNQFFWNNTTNRLGIGTATPNSKLSVNGLNTGLPADGFNNWISADFGGTSGNRVILGIQNGEATVGAHNATLNGWAGLTINPSGIIKMPSIANVGTRMVTVGADGTLASQTIPTGADNLGNHTATQNININNNWLSNDSTNKGIRLTNQGAVGINVSNPAGTFDIARQGSIPGANISVNSSIAGYSANYNSSSAQNAFAPYSSFSPYYANNGSPYRLIADFGASNPTTLVQLKYAMYSTAIGNASSLSYTLNVEGSNDGTNYTTLVNSFFNETFLFNSFSTFFIGTLNDRQVSFSNSTAYRFYRISFINLIQTFAAQGISYTGSDIHIRSMELFAPTFTTTYTSGAFTVLENGNTGVGTNAPTANLDVVGSLRLRNGAANNAILTSDASGNATWVNGLSLTNATVTNATLTNTTGTNASFSSMGVGIAAPTANKLTVAGTGGVRVNSTNTGATNDFTDWIASNVGGTAGDRVVSGTLGGNATIGAHNNALNAWSNLVINNASGFGATVTIGGNANVTPPNPTNGTVNTTIQGANNQKLIVNGAVRQAVNNAEVSIPANSYITITWVHNLGYSPIVMTSTEQSGGGNMDFVNVTMYNNNVNELVFLLRNSNTSNAATGRLRWIQVW